MRLLVVDDERELADAVAKGLRNEGYAVDVAYDGDEALDKLGYTPYDLICLDVTMPGTDGRAVCRAVRADVTIDPQPRVLMLTARDALEDRIAGLDDGADDYLVKPFAFGELGTGALAAAARPGHRGRCCARRRRARHRTAPGAARRSRARPHGQGVRAAALLHGQRRCGPVAGDAARARVGRARRPFTNTVRVTIGTLRRKLMAGGEPTVIDTVIGRGYRFHEDEPSP
ncbi:MAG: response regulator [Acidimicrobiales bacterium]